MRKKDISISQSLLCADDDKWRIMLGGQQIGTITYEVHENETSLQEINANLWKIATNIEVSHFPLVVIHDIFIDKAFRRRRNGTNALIGFTDKMRKQGVKVAMLCVGVDDFSTRHGKKTAIWLSEWYEKLDFTPFMKNGVKIVSKDYSIALTNNLWRWHWKTLI